MKQWYTTAPNRLPTKNDTKDEVMIDTAIRTPVFSGPAVVPENTSHRKYILHHEPF